MTPSTSNESKPQVKREPIMVSVSLDMLRWLALGLAEGRVAASPYAIRDTAVYGELAAAIDRGEQAERLSVARKER